MFLSFFTTWIFWERRDPEIFQQKESKLLNEHWKKEKAETINWKNNIRNTGSSLWALRYMGSYSLYLPWFKLDYAVGFSLFPYLLWVFFKTLVDYFSEKTVNSCPNNRFPLQFVHNTNNLCLYIAIFVLFDLAMLKTCGQILKPHKIFHSMKKDIRIDVVEQLKS